jgi:plasmid stabilization system protein ParE
VVKKRIIQASLAELDLLEHVDYISDHNLDAALRFIVAVEKAFNRLLDMPKIGVIREFKSHRASNVRMWPIPNI